MQAPRSINPLAQTAVLLLADIASQHRLWGWSRLARGTNALAAAPGLVFSKILGSGYEGGFGLKPSASRQGQEIFWPCQTVCAGYQCIAARPHVPLSV